VTLKNKAHSSLSSSQEPTVFSPSLRGGVIEEEIKLLSPSKKILNQIKQDPLLEKQAVAPWGQQPLFTIYFDTSDRYLLKNRIALRLRRGDDSSFSLGLKGFGALVDGVARRMEWEQPLTSPPNSFYSGLHYSTMIPGLVKDQLDELTVSGPHSEDCCFLPLMETDFSRQTQLLALGEGCEVEVALDWGVVRAGGRQRDLCEIEIEKVSGPSHPMQPFVTGLVERYGLKVSEQSKFSIGLALLGIKIS
jgi:triphosphatase